MVGGGLAGGAAACHLARAGRAVCVLEREPGPAHKVCGEFLSGSALAELAALGLDVAALGAAPIGAMRLVHRGRTASATLPFRAAGLSRRTLDEALLQRAAALGATVHRNTRVRSAGPGAVHTDAGTVPADTLLLATGKHDLRGLSRPARPGPLIGFKQHLRLHPAQAAELAGHVEVVLFRGGYAGLQPVGDGLANLCLLVDRERFAAEGQDWPALLDALGRDDAHLRRRLDGAVPDWDRPLAIARVPYGFVHRGPEQPGVFRLGDQAAVIPSFCGDGMAIALHSARLAAAAVLAGQSPAAFHRALRRDTEPPVRLAGALYRLAQSAAIRTALITAARSWPGLMQVAARRTRVAAPAPHPSPLPAGKGAEEALSFREGGG